MVGVQVDLELEGLVGLVMVVIEDKVLQFGCFFQRYVFEFQFGFWVFIYLVFCMVYMQGQWVYCEGYLLLYELLVIDGLFGFVFVFIFGFGVGCCDFWIECGLCSFFDLGCVFFCLWDGEWFIKMLWVEVEKLEYWCQQMECEVEDYELFEEILEKICSVVGSI